MHQRHLADRLAGAGGTGSSRYAHILGFIAVTTATINVVGDSASPTAC